MKTGIVAKSIQRSRPPERTTTGKITKVYSKYRDDTTKKVNSTSGTISRVYSTYRATKHVRKSIPVGLDASFPEETAQSASDEIPITTDSDGT